MWGLHKFYVLTVQDRWQKVCDNVHIVQTYERYIAVRKRAIIVASCLLGCISFVCAHAQSPLVPLAVFACAATTLLAIVQPALSLLLVCACAGLPSMLLSLPGLHMHLVEPAIGLCFVVVALHRPRAHLSIPHLLAVAFLLLAFVSFAHVPEMSSARVSDVYGADKRLLTLCLVLGALFCGTLLASYIKDDGRFLVGLLFVSLPSYLIALAQYVGIPLASWLEASGANDPGMNEGRLWGPFPWSVNFGMYLVNLFAVAIACWLLGRCRWQRSAGAFMTLTTSLCIVGTGTRSAALAAIVMILLALSMTRRFRLLGGIFLLTALTGALFSARIAAFFTHDETSTANRLLIWSLALKLIRANPWLGIGLEQFHYYYTQLIVSRADELGALGIHPHQQYLEWAMESGPLWLLLGILLLLSIIIFCIRGYYQAPPTCRLISLAALLAVIANALIGFFDAPLDQLEGPTMLFLVTGLALGRILSIENGRGMSTLSSWTRRICSKRIWLRRAAFQSMPSLRASVGREGAGMNGARTERTIILQLLSWAVALPLIFPTTALLARYLGPVQYGEYSLTFPFLTIFALLSGTGMDPLIIRQLSNRPRSAWGEILSYALGSRLISTLASSAVGILVACLLPIQPEQRNLFLIGCTSLLFSFSFNGLRIIFSHGFRAEQCVGPLALLEAANRMLTAALIALVVVLHLALFWIYVVVIYSDLPAFLLQAWLAYKRYNVRLRFSLPLLREHMLTGLPLLGHRTLTLLAGQIDLLILTVESTPVNVGIYALASRITDPLISIAHVYVNGLYPVFCTSFHENRSHFASLYSEAMRVLLLVTLPFVVVVTVEVSSIVRLLGGEQFEAATTIVQILMWTMALTFLNHLAESACTAANLERRVPLVTAASTLVNLVANLLLIPRWQIIGASVAALGSEGITLCLFLLLLKTYVRPMPLLETAVSIFMSNLLALSFFRWQSSTSALLTIPIGMVLIFISYLLTGTVVRSDIIKIREILGNQSFVYRR